MRLILLLLVAISLEGCASRPLQTDKFFANQNLQLPQSHVIEGVPFIRQEIGHCGPATLAMVMNWLGKNVSADDLAKQVYTPGMKGSLQLDLVSASRRHGLLAIPIQGLDALLTEVAAGHPVIIFENLGLSWFPQWHYAVVFGYDLDKRTLTMHSGPDAILVSDIRRFEKDWMLGEYWGLVVLSPGELSATADEFAHIKAASSLEQLKELNEAYKSYSKILERWPESLAANIGSANIAFERKDIKGAEGFLLRATVAHPESSVAWHNLAIAYGALNQKVNAQKAARRAIELAAADVKPVYYKSLREWLP
jgi:tetratricopeptide (TPR) repeat protein